MPHVYILESKKLNRYYIGMTLLDVEIRIKKHKMSCYGNKSFTSKANDWILVLALECDDKNHAFNLEKKIKKMKSSIYIQNLLRYPELCEKIIDETRMKK